MEDTRIIELYWARDERAIPERIRYHQLAQIISLLIWPKSAAILLLVSWTGIMLHKEKQR